MKTLCGIAVLGLVVLLTGAASAWAAVAAEDGNGSLVSSGVQNRYNINHLCQHVSISKY